MPRACTASLSFKGGLGSLGALCWGVLTFLQANHMSCYRHETVLHQRRRFQRALHDTHITRQVGVLVRRFPGKDIGSPVA